MVSGRAIIFHLCIHCGKPFLLYKGQDHLSTLRPNINVTFSKNCCCGCMYVSQTHHVEWCNIQEPLLCYPYFLSYCPLMILRTVHFPGHNFQTIASIKLKFKH